jgi:hypothetical protein
MMKHIDPVLLHVAGMRTSEAGVPESHDEIKLWLMHPAYLALFKSRVVATRAV